MQKTPFRPFQHLKNAYKELLKDSICTRRLAESKAAIEHTEHQIEATHPVCDLKASIWFLFFLGASTAIHGSIDKHPVQTIRYLYNVYKEHFKNPIAQKSPRDPNYH